MVKALDDANVPLSYGRNRTKALLSVAVGNALLSDAIRARQERDRAPFADDGDEAEQ